MANIVFYNTTPIDKIQLTEGLKPTDHYWRYIDDHICTINTDQNAEVISVAPNESVTAEIMDSMPRLRLIAIRGTNSNHIDLDHAKQRNIVVVNVPSYGENTVAEYAFGLILILTRKMYSAIGATKRGNYSRKEFIGTDLAGKTLGIIGAGRTGGFMAKMAQGFGMNVIASDPKPDSTLATQYNFKYETFENVLENSDIISLHTPLNQDSFHMINSGTIERMKDGVILINVAHEQLIEKRGLIEAINSGKIAGAGLDTIEGDRFLSRENLINKITENAASPSDYVDISEISILEKMPNVIITQRNSYNTIQATERINKNTTKNIIDFWYGISPNRIKAPKSSGELVIVRHGESEWNALGKWTGTTDVHTTEKGIDESAQLGAQFKDIKFDYAFISQQIRTKETLEAFLNGSGQLDLRFESAGAINERDYGIYTGMRKYDIEKIIGEEEFTKLRRSWDGPVEGGESLKDVYERSIPFYLRIILPRLRHGQNILVVAHGNSIRSLIKYIENISDEDIGSLEMIHGAAMCYEVDAEGRAKKKEIVEIPNITSKS